MASEWLLFSSYIALIWLKFGFNMAFSEDLGLLPDCYQIAVLCHLAAKRFFSFASAWLQFCFNFASVLLHFGFLRSNAIFIVCSRWLSFASALLQLGFLLNRSHASGLNEEAKLKQNREDRPALLPARALICARYCRIDVVYLNIHKLLEIKDLLAQLFGWTTN